MEEQRRQEEPVRKLLRMLETDMRTSSFFWSVQQPKKVSSVARKLPKLQRRMPPQRKHQVRRQKIKIRKLQNFS